MENNDDKNLLLSLKGTPRDRIHTPLVTRNKVAQSVAGEVSCLFPSVVELLLELCPVCRWEEEFNKWLWKGRKFSV